MNYVPTLLFPGGLLGGKGLLLVGRIHRERLANGGGDGIEMIVCFDVRTPSSAECDTLAQFHRKQLADVNRDVLPAGSRRRGHALKGPRLRRSTASRERENRRDRRRHECLPDDEPPCMGEKSPADGIIGQA